MKLSTICLSSCSGCHINLLHLHDMFLNLLSSMQLVFSPLLMDIKQPQECDIAIVEGGIRNEEDIEKVTTLRAKTTTLIAMGTCAVYGGVAGLGNSFNHREFLQAIYPVQSEGKRLRLVSRVMPIDSAVVVDYYVPGCPPPPEVIETCMQNILKGEVPKVNNLPVCAECPRVVRGEFSPEMKRTFESQINPEECLLQQGFVCMGSVTRAGCGGVCTAAGTPCIGCRGPSHRVMLEATHGIYEDWVRRRCHYLGLSEKEVEHHLKNIKHNFYSFCLSMPFMRQRKTERVAEFLYRVNWDKEMVHGT